MFSLTFGSMISGTTQTTVLGCCLYAVGRQFQGAQDMEQVASTFGIRFEYFLQNAPWVPA